jgi:hypothetical protein
MRDYADIPIAVVAGRCGIDIDARSTGRAELEARCPFCGDRPKGRHLYLNTEKNQYICFLCGAKGNSVSLYARLENLSYGGAARELLSETNAHTRGFAVHRSETPLVAAKPLSERHAVYSSMLAHLGLSAGHREDLRKRGFSDERIELNMYRSLPGDGNARSALARLLSDFYDLSGIPGFYRDRAGSHRIAGKPGLLIPVRGKDGMIPGMQIRVDDAGAKRKYRWLSSGDMKGGAKSEAFIHVTGDTSRDTAYITEGPLKGDAASFLSDDALFVCVAGVNAVRGLPETLLSLGVKNAVITLDMDRLSNPHVGKAAENIAAAVRAAGIRAAVKSWNAAYNGIDDYYFSLRRAAA